MKKKIVTTEILEDVIRKTSADKISINDLISAMNVGGFGLVMMIFALPIIIPLPPPLPSIMSVPVVVFSFQMMVGFSSPKLPKRLSNIAIKRSILAMLVEKSAPYLSKAEKLLKPRLSFFSSSWFEKIIGFFTFIFSLLVLLPIPFSNFLPGLGVLVTSFGLIGRDGLVIITGLAIGIIGAIIVAITLLFGIEALYWIKNFAVNIIH